MANKKKNGTVKTRGVQVDTTYGGPVGATVWPSNHPRHELNVAPYVRTSKVEKIIIYTRNTRYVWELGT